MSQPLNVPLRTGPAANTRAFARSRLLAQRQLFSPPPPPTPPSPPTPAMADAPAHDPMPVVNHGLPSPGSFHGTDTENGVDWLDSFNLYAAYKNMTAEVKLAAFAMLLKGNAAAWYRTLEAGQRDTTAHLTTAFTVRYGPAQHSLWQRNSQLWLTKQQPAEKVQDYMARVLRAAQDANVPEAQRHLSVVNGLLPAIRQHVLLQDPADLAAVRTAALLAEQSQLPSLTTDEVLDSIRRLERQFQGLTVSALRPPSPGRDRDGLTTRNRSLSRERRVSTLQRPPWIRDQPPGRSISTIDDRRRRDFLDRRPPSLNPDYQRRASPYSTGVPRRVQFTGYPGNRQTGQSARPYPSSPRQNCNSCGEAHNRNTCRFRQTIRRMCNRVGHIAPRLSQR
jgi:hypothetical protein